MAIIRKRHLRLLDNMNGMEYNRKKNVPGVYFKNAFIRIYSHIHLRCRSSDYLLTARK